MIIIQQHPSTADIDTYIRPFIRSLRLVCLPWQRRYGKHYNDCRTNAAAEASYDRRRSLALRYYCVTLAYYLTNCYVQYIHVLHLTPHWANVVTRCLSVTLWLAF